MDFQRIVLLIALTLISWQIYSTWVYERGPVTDPLNQSNLSQDQAVQSQIPNVGKEEMNQIPNIVADNGGSDLTNSIAGTKQTNILQKNDVYVKTDVFEADIDKHGGALVGLRLSQYPVDIENKNIPFSLLQHQSKPFYIAESGIKGVSNSKKNQHPNHNQSVYQSAQDSYELSGDELRVPLVWQGAGVEIIKTYIFKRGSYHIGVEYTINNQSDNVWKGAVYGQLKREGLLSSEERGLTNYSYTGGAIYTKEENYQKIDFDDLDSANLNITSDYVWVGFIQHYFTGAIIPENKSIIYSYKPNNQYVIGARMPLLSVDPVSSKVYRFNMFLGPKIQDQMKLAKDGLELTVDYGWLTVIAKPIFWLMKQIHSFVFNWGLAIIFVTLLIKLGFYKLSATSYKSMAKMRKLQPRVLAIKERCGDDRQKLSQATMKLYKEEKVNPMSGCLPILVQMPVFIALYWVLLESVELRQAEFLWLEDLSIKDPYFILPVIMGLSMIIQQKLNPKPADPIQAKVMMALPLVFGVFFAFFPSGLVLYWAANNILSIAQQWTIIKRYGV